MVLKLYNFERNRLLLS